MAGKATHNPDEIFTYFVRYIQQGFSRSEAAKKCGVSRAYPDRCFTDVQKARIDQEYFLHTHQSPDARPKGQNLNKDDLFY